MNLETDGMNYMKNSTHPTYFMSIELLEWTICFNFVFQNTIVQPVMHEVSVLLPLDIGPSLSTRV